MKFHLSAYALLLFYATATQGQFRLSANAGPQWSSMKATSRNAFREAGPNPFIQKRASIHLGLQADIPLEFSDRFTLITGVNYSGKGRKYTQINSDEKAALSDTLFQADHASANYIEFPVVLNYQLPLHSKKKIQIGAGWYGAFFLNGKSIQETKLLSSNKYYRMESTMDAGNRMNSARVFDGGFTGRASVDMGKFTFTVFYQHGFVRAFRDYQNNTYRHSVTGINIGFWLMKEVPRKPIDTDQDGTYDSDDHCPLLPGPSLTNGCPDRDNDGIADHNDRCPDENGLARYQGCPIPDKDQDGLNDEVDHCPDEKGFSRYNGCPIPDRDKDGSNDEVDQCPDQPGKATYKGCPVPDTDGDGWDDEHDRCPEVKGIPEEEGCPLTIQKAEQKIAFAANNIFFASSSAVIDSTSYVSLNEVVALLNEFSGVTLQIEGHTDSTGNAMQNQLISQQRADAVKNYLITKWIDPKRLTAKGFGQTHPVTTNETVEGRAMNRRVELKIKK